MKISLYMYAHSKIKQCFNAVIENYKYLSGSISESLSEMH